MAIRINTNMFSLWANRNLLRTSQTLSQSYERLSSGEKINRAGDDPAGLANSNALRSKIAGLQRNQMNANAGLNLTSVAESALGTVSEILQRLRELTVRAASDTMSDSDRQLTQKEVEALLDEIQHIASTANYNDKRLLDGSFSNMKLQVGTRTGQSIPVSIQNMGASVLGSVARVTGSMPVDGNLIDGPAQELWINGVAIPTSQSDGISTTETNASSLAKAAAINSMTHLTGVKAYANPTAIAGAGAVQSGALDGVGSALLINGVNIGPVNYLAGDSNGALRDRINAQGNETGVTASLGASGELVLTARDGRNVEATALGSAAADFGLAAGVTVHRGTVTLESASPIRVEGALSRIGLTAGQADVAVDPGTAIRHMTVTTGPDAQNALTTIDVAISQVLAVRADLGALESRLNKTISDLAVSIENLTAADSRIRDADFAVEAAKMTQAQIIQEAGVAILAQANVIPQMALNLLQR